MGFTISNYSLFGLQPQNFYVSIRGCFNIEKNNIPSPNGPIWIYVVRYTVYYSSSKSQPVITQKEQSFNIEQLPEPANIYIVIYNEIKKNIDPQYNTPEQTLTFTDD
jgi:hypothetical protein